MYVQCTYCIKHKNCTLNSNLTSIWRSAELTYHDQFDSLQIGLFIFIVQVNTFWSIRNLLPSPYTKNVIVIIRFKYFKIIFKTTSILIYSFNIWSREMKEVILRWTYRFLKEGYIKVDIQSNILVQYRLEKIHK